MIEVIALAPFINWYASLDADDLEVVARSVDVLSMTGVAVSHPQSRAMEGATFGLRELRVRMTKLRVFYALDSARQMVLLLGGDHRAADKRLDALMIARCEATWRKYLNSYKRRPL